MSMHSRFFSTCFAALLLAVAAVPSPAQQREPGLYAKFDTGMGEIVAPMLAPFPCDRALALEHQEAHRDALGAAEVASVPRLAERMADALTEGVRRGLTGVATDVEWQNHAFPLDLSTITCPVRLWWGNADAVTPPAFARWYVSRLRTATLTLVPEAGHYLPMTHWAELLEDVRSVA